MASDTAKSHIPNPDMSAYQQLFLDEAQTFLGILRRGLDQLVEDPGDKEAQREARRAAHTLKGMAAMMHYEHLVSLSKSLEDQLQTEAPLFLDQIETLRAGCNELEIGVERLAEGGDAPRHEGSEH
jgi:chemotaxis protein histidine kinase CheA